MSISSYDFASRRGQATDRRLRGGGSDGRPLWNCPAPTANDGVRAFRWVDTKSAPEVARVARRVHHDDSLLRRPGAPPAGLKGWRTPPQPWAGGGQPHGLAAAVNPFSWVRAAIYTARRWAAISGLTCCQVAQAKRSELIEKSTLAKTTSTQPVLTSRAAARPDVRLRTRFLALQLAHRSNIGRRLLPRHA